MKRFVCGIFDQEDTVLRAVKAAPAANIPIFDVYTPFAVHGLDEAMGIARSRLPWVCLVASSIGCVLALGFQMWTSAVDWPMIVGGKPFLAIPAFIPVTFEVTVLLGGLATVAAFFARSKLFPGKSAMQLDLRITDGHFIVAVESCDASLDIGRVRDFLKKWGAVEIFEKEVRV